MGIDFRFKDYLYPTTLTRLYRQFNRNQWLTSQELTDLQLSMLKRVCTHCQEFVPHYRKLFEKWDFDPSRISSPSDLSRLPLLSKDELRRSSEALRADNSRQYVPKLESTSGTSGPPVQFFSDRLSRSADFMFYLRWWSWFGYRLGQSFAQLNTGHFLNRPKILKSACRWQTQYRRLLINPLQLSRFTIKSITEQMFKRRIRYIIGAASMVFNLALVCRENRVTPAPLKAAFTGGDRLEKNYRKVIGEVFGCPVNDFYGHMENTVKICQCPKGSYHVCSDFGILEADSPRPLKDGDHAVASIVGTSLHKWVQPLIRYDTRDEIEVFRQPKNCACGRSFPIVRAIIGRRDDFVLTPDGRRITLYLQEYAPHAQTVQVVQTSNNELEILVLPDTDWSPQDAEKLKEKAISIVGEKLHITIREVRKSELLRGPTGKIQAVINQVGETLHD